MKRRPKSQPTAVGTVLPGVLRDLGLGDAAVAARLSEAWPELVGPEAARQSWPAGLREGVLEVEVTSSVWAQQLQLRRPELLRALADFFAGHEGGKSVPPRDLHFRMGRSQVIPGGSQTPGR